MSTDTLVDRIDALLPQTQCTRCGFSGCRPYAEAIAKGEAPINQCPPGGATGIVKLADLLKTLPQPLNPANGVEKPLEVALIDESLCIGCTLCIQACPVDAIIGAPKLMHTILNSWCTGCELCIAPCPVDCISMVPAVSDTAPMRLWSDADAALARQRYYSRNDRLDQEQREKEARLAGKSLAAKAPASVSDAASVATDATAAAAQTEADAATAKKKAIIAAAIERAKQQRAAAQPKNVDAASAEVARQIAEADARRARQAGHAEAGKKS